MSSFSQVNSCHALQAFSARCLWWKWLETTHPTPSKLFFLDKQQPVLPPSSPPCCPPSFTSISLNHAEQTLYSSAPACSHWSSLQKLTGTFPLCSWSLSFSLFPSLPHLLTAQCHSCHGVKPGENPAAVWSQQCGEHAVFFAHGVYCFWHKSVHKVRGGTSLSYSTTIWFTALSVRKVSRIFNEKKLDLFDSNILQHASGSIH